MFTTYQNAFILSLGALLTVASPAAGQVGHETQAQLKAEAKVSMTAAKRTALAQLPRGRVKSSELERENGALVYSFDIVTRGKPGIDEVQIDAVTGAMVGLVKHETAEMERAEQKMEAMEKKHDAMNMKHGSAATTP